MFFIFFPSPHFSETILASRTFGFAPTCGASPSAKPKELLFRPMQSQNDVSYLKYQVYPDN
jgi:hypothetical protein